MTVSYQDIPDYLFHYLLEWGDYIPSRPWGAATGAAIEHAAELGLLVGTLKNSQVVLSDFGKASAQRHFNSVLVGGDPNQHAPDSTEASPVGIDATLVERGSRYGDFVEHARITQNIKRAMQDSPNWNKLADDQKEALEMLAHKVGRILNGDPNYADSWTDIIGYARLVEKRLLP